jgi:hypothetical protein
MGWKLKALAVLVGLMLIPLGGWPVSAILFLYAVSGLFLRGLRRGRGRTTTAGVSAPTSLQQGVQAAPTVGFKRSFGHPVRSLLGLAFLGLSAVAFSRGGTLSPFVFGGVGAVLLLWGTSLFRLGSLGSLRPVEESILLRGNLDPIHWFAMVEVKLATRQVGKALGGIDETVLVALGDGVPSIFVVLKTASLTLRGAEESLLARFGELTRISAPLGAYLLPLDSRSAVGGPLSCSVEHVEFDSKGWPSPVSTTDYDLLTVEARRGGFVHAVGAYRKEKVVRNANARVILPPATQQLSRPSLLWEVFQELGKKVQLPKPDGYTTFLASVFATGGETIGERVSEVGSTGSQNEVLVQSLGAPAVQISRAQLRAIARIYA